MVHVQSILYSSLAASLLAAFIAMLGEQWLDRYAQVEMRGSVIDRSRHRQRKMDGTWGTQSSPFPPFVHKPVSGILSIALINPSYLFYNTENLVSVFYSKLVEFTPLFYFPNIQTCDGKL